MKTPFYDILDAMKAWVFPMLLPLSQMILDKSAIFNILYITVLFPILMYYSSLKPSFQIRSETFVIIMTLTFLVSYGFYRMSKKSKEALKDPMKHRLISIPLYLTIVTSFFVIMFSIGAFVRPLYSYKLPSYA